MLDINFIRKSPEKVKAAVTTRGIDPARANVDKFLELDEKRKSFVTKVESLREERNSLSKGITGKPDQSTIAKVKTLKTNLESLEKDLSEIEKEWFEIQTWFPNIPLDEVPLGKSDKENIEIKAWHPKNGYLKAIGGVDDSKGSMDSIGAHANIDFTPKPHWELGVELGLLDLEAGAKVSGSRFYYLKADGALLIHATFNYLFRKLLKEGFEPMIVPLLVKEKALFGTSHFPADADQVYSIDNKFLEDSSNTLYLVGSSEPANFAYFMDAVLDKKDLPKKFMAQTACFRSEVGSWGKDVRGMKRTHQFDKLEMNMVVENDLEKAREMHEYLLSLNEWLLQELEIPYHVINMCTADLGYFAAAKKYDIEVWLPSQNEYMEVMSNSITTDFQSRRLNIKYRDSDGSLKYPYTLNDTGITHRILIAIMEHYQQSDGTILVPEVLRDYVGKDAIGK